MSTALIGPLVVLVVVIATIGVTLGMRHRGYSGIGGNTIVRCRAGHLFTTLWLPGGSFKAVRLGFYRFQYCPVGKHWTLVAPVKEADLTPAELKSAKSNRDIRVP